MATYTVGTSFETEVEAQTQAEALKVAEARLHSLGTDALRVELVDEGE